LIGIVLPELAAPLANRFVRHLDATFQENFLNVTEAQGELIREPDPVANDFARKAVILVPFGVRGRVISVAFSGVRWIIEGHR
jgi:hypothetical protein